MGAGGGSLADQALVIAGKQPIQCGGIFDAFAVQFQAVDFSFRSTDYQPHAFGGNALALEVRPRGLFLGGGALLSGNSVFEILKVFLFLLVLGLVAAVSVFLFQIIQFLLNARKLFSVGLVPPDIGFQAVHGIGVRFNDGVHLFVGEPHTLQKFPS